MVAESHKAGSGVEQMDILVVTSIDPFPCICFKMIVIGGFNFYRGSTLTWTKQMLWLYQHVHNFTSLASHPAHSSQPAVSMGRSTYQMSLYYY